MDTITEVHHQFTELSSKTNHITAPWKKYSNRINYSSCNEDTSSELEVLKPDSGKTALCITAGGGRVLNLLANQLKEIWAVDVNIWQNCLLELKIAAMRFLDYNDFLSFMGDKPSNDRLKTYKEIEYHLSKEARYLFNSKKELISKGILFQGNLERFFSITSKILNLVWSKKSKRLFEFIDLLNQREFLTKEWDRSLWKLLAQSLCRKTFLKLFADDPGFIRFLPEDLPIHRRILECIHRYLWNNLAWDNSLLSLIFFGRYINESSKPLYLQEKYYYKIKEALNNTKIKIITGMLWDVLREAPQKTFDCYSLSDIVSYMDDNTFHSYVDEVMRTAKSGAKICIRACLAPRSFSEHHARYIHRDLELEQKLALHDHAMVHEFLAGEIS